MKNNPIKPLLPAGFNNSDSDEPMFHNKVSHRNMPEAKTALELITKASSWN
jgi:hypothetical protein